MHEIVTLDKYREVDNCTEIIIRIPDKKIGEFLSQKCIKKAEMRFDDGRSISIEQRKKAYATIRDIADYTGNDPEYQKEWLKCLYVEKTGDDYISLSDCSMDQAREFINVILEYAIENGIQLSEQAINRTDDIGKYLYFCIKHKKCAICGQAGEIHHEDAIGMGNDRKTLDDSNHKKICLCRNHHTIAHQMGVERFTKMYKVYGIIIKEESSERKSEESESDRSEEQKKAAYS